MLKLKWTVFQPLRGQMWNGALYGTQHLSEEKEKESKIKEKITKLREEIVWLPIVKQLWYKHRLFMKTVLYTAQPVSRCSIGAKEVDEVVGSTFGAMILK